MGQKILHEKIPMTTEPSNSTQYFKSRLEKSVRTLIRSSVPVHYNLIWL